MGPFTDCRELIFRTTHLRRGCGALCGAGLIQIAEQIGDLEALLE